MKHTIQSPHLHDNDDYLRDFEISPDWKFNTKSVNDNKEYITTDNNALIVRSTIESKPVEFKRTFTSSGIGYSFNSNSFWSLYKDTSPNRDFYNVMQNDTATKNPNQYFPKSAGPKMALSFVLQPNPSRKWDQYSEQVFQTLRLNIHDPKILADFEDEFIEIQSGKEGI